MGLMYIRAKSVFSRTIGRCFRRSGVYFRGYINLSRIKPELIHEVDGDHRLIYFTMKLNKGEFTDIFNLHLETRLDTETIKELSRDELEDNIKL